MSDALCMNDMEALVRDHDCLARYAVNRLRKKVWIIRKMDREDCLSIARLAMVKSVHHWKPDQGTKFSTYMMRSVYNLLWHRARQEYRRAFLYAEPLADWIPELAREVQVGLDQDEWRLVARAMGRLRHRTRQVMELVHMDGMSRKNAAKALGISVQRVEQHMKVGMKDLRRLLGVEEEVASG